MTPLSPSQPPIGAELILGRQKSGKSLRAETLARDWLAQSGAHRALLIATAEAHDEEMRERIARHQRDRARRVPTLRTLEEAHDLAAALARHSDARSLLIVDCLTLWLTHWLMPWEPDAGQQRSAQVQHAQGWPDQCALFLQALRQARGPVLLVGNEIGLGLSPMGSGARAFVDALGVLQQQLAQLCPRVTLMVAGLPLTLKEPGR